MTKGNPSEQGFLLYSQNQYCSLTGHCLSKHNNLLDFVFCVR